jgi:hypothetical protein
MCWEYVAAYGCVRAALAPPHPPSAGENAEEDHDADEQQP